MDCRKDCIFTIDPLTARDLDDALSISPLTPEGTHIVGVHIADVTYFVAPKTHVDFEAQKRATTIYLVHKVLPMLPHVLSSDLCSLNPGKDRLAFSVFWEMTPDGKRTKKKPTFARVNICAAARTTNFDHILTIHICCVGLVVVLCCDDGRL
jgi:protein SSD1